MDEAEVIGAGTFNGTVSYYYMGDDDEDYYEISVPAKTKMTVTVKKTGGDNTVYVRSYDEYKSQMNQFIDGIGIMLDTAGETDTGTIDNNAYTAKTYYLGFTGDADYKCTIEFGDSGSSDQNAIPHGDTEDSSCGSIMVLSVVGVLFVIVLVAGQLKKKRMN
ncbi:MAG: hypothetical protein U9R75_05645 [Candidatus Thermoplasmatota archaeon]|nr:hypothetical protein [Candidatus Thermoplasmatota archaeon]